MSGKTPHDNLFRLAFSQLPHAMAHFRATLPAAVVDAVRWETLVLQPGSFVDPELQHLQSDVLYRAELGAGGEVCLYVLFEHQARPDALMPFRLLRYMVRIWERPSLYALRCSPSSPRSSTRSRTSARRSTRTCAGSPSGSWCCCG